MKSYIPYRDIRKEALIFGLPVYLFALQMIAVIVALLAIIFAFGWLSILIGCSGNFLLYLVLLNFKKLRSHIQFFQIFPRHISTKQISSDSIMIKNYESL